MLERGTGAPAHLQTVHVGLGAGISSQVGESCIPHLVQLHGKTVREGEMIQAGISTNNPDP